MARYEAPLGSAHTLGLQVDGNARDSFFNVPGNDSAALVPKFAQLNARIDIADIADRYKIGVSGKNLLNDHYITSIFLLQGLAIATPSSIRHAGSRSMRRSTSEDSGGAR